MIEIIDLLKPKNGGSFKLIEDIDIAVDGYSSLADCVAHMATTAMIEAINAVLSDKQDELTTAQLAACNSGITSELVSQIDTNTTAISDKANTSDVTTATANLQAQIDAIITPVTEDAEVQNARVDSLGKSHTTLKARLDDRETEIFNSINPINHTYTASSSASGGVNFDYNIYTGCKYSVHNTGAGKVAIRCNSGGSAVLIEDNVVSGASFEFVSEYTGTLRIYFYAASSVEISGGRFKVLESNLSDLEDTTERIIKGLNYDFYSYSCETILANQFYVTNGGIGTTIPSEPESANGWSQEITQVKADDLFMIKGTGSETGLLYCFTDENKRIVAVTDTSSATDLQITAPVDGYLYFTYYTNSSHYIKKYESTTINDIDEYMPNIKSLSGLLDESVSAQLERVYLKYTEEGYYDVSGGVGTTVPDTPSTSTQYTTAIVKVSKKDRFVLSGEGGTAPRIWAFTDVNRTILSISSETRVTAKELTAPADGYLYIGVYFNTDHSLYRYVTSIGSTSEYIAPDFAVGTLNSNSKLKRDSETRYADMISFLDMIALEFNHRIEKTEIGTSQEPDTTFSEIDDSVYPIYAYTFRGSETETANENKIILASGIHGDDLGNGNGGDGIEGATALAYLLKDIYTNPDKIPLFSYIKKYCNLVVCPILNPWGYQNGYRHNGRRVDLNRNFPTGFTANRESYGCTSGSSALSEAESNAWATYIDENHSDAKFMIEMHTRGGFEGISASDNRWSGFYMNGVKTTRELARIAGNKMVARYGGVSDLYTNGMGENGEAVAYFSSEGIPILEPEAFRTFGGNANLTHGSDEVIRQMITFISELLNGVISAYIKE